MNPLEFHKHHVKVEGQAKFLEADDLINRKFGDCQVRMRGCDLRQNHTRGSAPESQARQTSESEQAAIHERALSCSNGLNEFYPSGHRDASLKCPPASSRRVAMTGTLDDSIS
jgi:hypothetical protein